MTIVQHHHLGPEAHPIEQGRYPHGRWRMAYHPATPGTDENAATPWPAALHIVHDAERLAFALSEGAAASVLAERLANYLWIRDSADGDWPVDLREWLAELDQWADAPAGHTAFITGRLERDIAGGRIYLAWLGMNGICLLDRHGDLVELDTVLSDEERWTPKHGPEPVGMGLHAYRGGLFGLDRLVVFTAGATPIGADLPDLAVPALEQALDDWAEGAASDLAFFDLRLNPLLTEPRHIAVNYRWIASDTCLLFWQPSPNATGYRIEEASTPTFEDATLIAELTDGRQIQYRLSPPASGTTYYRVIPLNQGVMGEPSTPFSVTPITLAAPIMEPVEWAASGGYVLRWTPIPQATSYEVQVSVSSDFDPHDSMVIFRGETPELHLPTESLPNQYYRVRAINALYAPHMPSTWSEPQRAPARLAKPIFTQVSPERMAWDVVPGARQYAIEVSDPADDEAEPEVITTVQPVLIPAEQPAVYRVRAQRHPDDLRTASEWSEAIHIAHDSGRRASRLDLRFAVPGLLMGALVALLVGIALGLLGLSAYQDANATATRTLLPEELAQATRQAATAAIGYATQARIQGTRAANSQTENRALLATNEAVERARRNAETTNTAVAQVLAITLDAELTRTHIPSATPTITPTPSITPNLTETIDTAFAAGLTATAAGWTATPSPTATFTPSITPNLTETIDAAFGAGLTATAAGWTATPTPTHTPSISPTPTATVTPSPTVTWTPSRTPNLDATLNALISERLTATATLWTATPSPTPTLIPTATPDRIATAAARQTATGQARAALAAAQTATQTAAIAALPAGCFLVALPDGDLPVYARPDPAARGIFAAAPLWLPVTGQAALPDGLWLQLPLDDDGLLSGWLRLPDDVALADVIGGSACDLAADVPDVSTDLTAADD